MNIIQAIQDKRIFAPLFKDLSTWRNWIVVLKALFALEMSMEELKIYQQFTGRKDKPAVQFPEAFLIVGRRGGKSFISALITVYLATCREWDLSLEKGYIMVIASDRKQARVVLEYVRRILRLPAFKSIISNETREEIELNNGMTIAIHTCSYRSLRGYTICACVLDEISFWRHEGANPSQEILTAIRPSLGNIPSSLLLGISTPYSKAGPLWEAFRDKYGQNDANSLVWKAGTLDMNPTYSSSVIDRALAEDYQAAQAEYLAEFRADLATFISPEELEACINPNRYELPPLKGLEYKGFVDPSGGRGDSMTLSICHKEHSGKIVQDCIRVKNPPFNPSECVKEFSEVLQTYNIDSISGDKYSGNWCTCSFDMEGIEYENSPLTKSELYMEFLPLVMQGRVELLDNKQQKVELLQLERRTGKGRDSVDHPRGLHDDIANACAGSIYLATKEERYIRSDISISSSYEEDIDNPLIEHSWLLDEPLKRTLGEEDAELQELLRIESGFYDDELISQMEDEE